MGERSDLETGGVEDGYLAALDADDALGRELGEAAEKRELLDGEALGYGSPRTGQTDGEAVLAAHLGMQIGDDFLAHGEQGEKPEPAGQVGADVGEYAYEVVAYARMSVYEPG